jgi:hypothetical protein
MTFDFDDAKQQERVSVRFFLIIVVAVNREQKTRLARFVACLLARLIDDDVDEPSARAK